MSSRPTPANGRSGVPPSSSTVRAKSGQETKPQSTTPGKAPVRQPPLKQGQASGRPAPSKSNTASTTSTTSTTSTSVKHNTYIPKERIAKLSGEGDDRARREASIEDALNKYKRAVVAEGKAKKAYTDHVSIVENDPNICGTDYYRGGLIAGELGTEWEKAAHSAALAHEAFKRAAAHNYFCSHATLTNVGDLGTKAGQVETALERHFALANKWGCVLLLDEADVFLAERSPQDFERNSLVAVFLRVFEFYAGVLFLTTNRDGACSGRVQGVARSAE
ncbi:uncharacterized protein B0H64DRAFT_439821 [Chaetomium fimeti]|uniref:ATPase AAA-type core domain-containing protein n=1 Tax=Chaetomium fimeti TaxID=1854472 RepID=A0AAE0LW07_9PEZI|nr:hypothetical protein B0H64DRAFT_439821 [Chaetomium fimeti]